MQACTIRRPTAADAAALTAHMADPAIFGNLLQLPYPTEALWQQRIANNNAAGSGNLMLIAERGIELLGFADRWGQVLLIELTVYADNDRAIRLYERFGFEREGPMRAYALRDGRFADTLAMARLHPSPPTLR